MAKRKRRAFDKLNTLLFGKDLRVTKGEPYIEERLFDYSSYYPVNSYIKPQCVPSDNVFDIRDYGADVNNDDNSFAINKAIDLASACCGTVLVDGGDFVSTTVMLKSGITLFITPNSSISANKSGVGYEEKKALVYAENASDITITGGGRLYGNGHRFGREPVAPCNNTKRAEYIDVIEMRQNYRSQLRFAHPSKFGGIIYFKGCRNIKAYNFILEDSPHWTFKISNCEGVDIHDFVINNNRNVANADGIDIAGTSDVNIDHCFISTADDGIVIKNANWLGNTGAMSDVKIANCEIISRTNAIKIGTETTFDISNIDIRHCKLFMTDVYPGSVSGISLEACDGTVLSGVTVDDIEMDRCTCPIFIRLGNRNRSRLVNEQSANAIEFGQKASKGGTASADAFDMKSQVRNIFISNVRATNVELPVIIAGFKQNGITKRVENVSLNNINIKYADIPETEDKRLFIPEYVDVYPECWRFRNLPAYALWIRHARNITISNFNCIHSQKTWKKDIITEDNLEYKYM